VPEQPADEPDRDRDDADDAGDDAGASEAELRDELPEELDVTGLRGPYRFPDNSRRRIPGALYLFLGLLCIAGWALRRGDDPVLVNNGTLAAGVALVAIALYCFAAGWRLVVDEKEALVIATRQAGFAVGHASAQLGWRGLRSRPTWRILSYSSEDPPRQRAFALIDAVDGEVLHKLVEDNPEDWSQL